jgi:Glycosyl transferase family 2
VEGTLLSETGGTATRVAAVLAAYNRRDLTLACLRSLKAQRLPTVTLDVFVLDDASSDGTREQVAEQFPEVTLLHGNGRLYWNGGMRRAFDAERRRRDRGEEAVIVAGSTRHPETGELTYGGVVQPYRWRPFKTVLVEPGDASGPATP